MKASSYYYLGYSFLKLFFHTIFTSLLHVFFPKIIFIITVKCIFHFYITKKKHYFLRGVLPMRLIQSCIAVPVLEPLSKITAELAVVVIPEIIKKKVNFFFNKRRVVS